MENAHNYYYWISFWYFNEYKDIWVFCGNQFKILDSQTFGHLIHLQLRKVIKAKVKHNILSYVNAILLRNFPKNSYLIHVCYNRMWYAFNNEKKKKKKGIFFWFIQIFERYCHALHKVSFMKDSIIEFRDRDFCKEFRYISNSSPTRFSTKLKHTTTLLIKLFGVTE